MAVPVCTASLITDRHVVTAAHCVDAIAQTKELLELFPEPGDPPVVITPTARFHTTDGELRIPFDLDAADFLPNWPAIDADLAILQLEQSAPPEIARYPIYIRPDEIGKEVVITGFGATGHGATGENADFGLDPPLFTERPLRAGLNRWEEIGVDSSGEVEVLLFDFDSGLTENNTLRLTDTNSELGFGVDEVGVGAGDSGGPVLRGGAIIGVLIAQQSFPDVGDVNLGNDGTWRELGVAIRTSNYCQFIFDATGGRAVFVAEPCGDLSV